MKKLILVISILTSIQSFAQNSKLSVYNPAPRVGEEIEITITLKKENIEEIELKGGKSIEEFNQLQDNFYGSGKIKFSNIANESGLKKFGPFVFNFDGLTISTDSIELTVYPALPDSVKDGIWIRNVDFNNKNYLIIEQRISNQWKREQTTNPTTLSFGGDDVTYAILDEDKFKSKGLKISSSSSSSSSQVVDKKDIFGSGTVSYRIATFQFEKTEDFKKKFKLDKKFFNGFPDEIAIEEVMIE